MYRPAFTPSGTDVPLARALAFADLYTQTVQEVARASAPPEPESAAPKGGAPKPVTVAEQAGRTAGGAPGARLGVLDVNRALYRPETAAKFAAIILVHEDGSDVTEGEALSADFPSGPFVEAWAFFLKRNAELTLGPMPSPGGSASPGETGEPAGTTTRGSGTSPASSSPT